jgi:hypothetical protein
MSSLLTNRQAQESVADALLEKLRRMTAALDDLWNRVEAGEFRVSSRALLRTARSVWCPDIGRRLRDSCPDCARISRDVRLLINTFEYIIKPEPIL